MGKIKPLTKYEQFVADNISGWHTTISRIVEVGERVDGVPNLVWRKEQRTPSEWRRLIRGRISGYNEEKFVIAREAFAELQEAFVSAKSWDELRKSFWKFSSALKYQGDLQMEIVFIEHLMQDDDLKQFIKEDMQKRKLKMKVERLSRIEQERG